MAGRFAWLRKANQIKRRLPGQDCGPRKSCFIWLSVPEHALGVYDFCGFPSDNIVYRPSSLCLCGYRPCLVLCLSLGATRWTSSLIYAPIKCVVCQLRPHVIVCADNKTAVKFLALVFIPFPLPLASAPQDGVLTCTILHSSNCHCGRMCLIPILSLRPGAPMESTTETTRTTGSGSLW